MGKVIGVLNQKGGVGKSTLTMLLATNIHIGENKKRDKDFVSVYDGDIPQYTIKNIRSTEQKILESRSENENDYYLKKYKKTYYDGFEPLKIYTGSITDIYDNFNILKQKHTYSFVDIVGTVNVEGYDHNFLANFDYLIIPTNLDYEVLRSTLNFVKNVVHPLHKSKQLNYSILLNNIDGREKSSAINTQEQLKGAGYPILDNIIYRKKKYISLYLDDYTGGMLSSLYDTFDSTTNKLISEVIKNIN